MRHARFITTATAITVLALAGCSSPSDPVAGSPSAGTTEAGGTVRVLTHDSFSIPEETLAAFEAESGLDVEFVSTGDGGALVNQLILTKDAPLADAVYGIDNTFASRVVGEGVLADYSSQSPVTSSALYMSLPAAENLTAIDFSDVCLNVDLTYFEAQSLAAPTSFDDLIKPEYANLTSVTNPATSSPGLAFLLATVAAYGDDWPTYWEALRDNGLRVTGSWSDTYFVDFSAPNYGGDRPIVLSYASSPPSEVIEGEPTTAALLDTCFRQVEYAGVLAGAKNPQGAQLVIDWMLSDDFQSQLPYSMYVYPVSETATVPQEWLDYAPLAQTPWSVSSEQIDQQREELVLTWTSLVLG
jgi:thiamine transport system substrate-binding protein